MKNNDKLKRRKGKELKEIKDDGRMSWYWKGKDFKKDDTRK